MVGLLVGLNIKQIFFSFRENDTNALNEEDH